MPEKLNLGINTEESEIMTFMKMYLELVETDLVTKDDFKRILLDIPFNEEVGYEYGGSDLHVGVATIPIITDGILKVKVVQLEQGDSIGLIVPANVANAYEMVLEDQSLINQVNQVEEIAFETFGFDASDTVLLELVAEIYVNADSQSPAFILTGEAKIEEEATKAEEEEEFDFNPTGSGSISEPRDNQSMFDSIQTPVEEIPDIDVNLESFKKFEARSNSLTLLEKKLFSKVPRALQEHIKTKYIADSKVLAVEVDNREIYKTFSNLPNHAKKLLTMIGESIRKNKTTQLVDSISHEGKRLFIIAESVNNNYWVVKDEEPKLLESANKRHKVVVPNKKEIITLNRTNIMYESRTKIPYKHGKQIAFAERFKLT